MLSRDVMTYLCGGLWLLFFLANWFAVVDNVIHWNDRSKHVSGFPIAGTMFALFFLGTTALNMPRWRIPAIAGIVLTDVPLVLVEVIRRKHFRRDK